jgi:hypothetical protein
MHFTSLQLVGECGFWSDVAHATTGAARFHVIVIITAIDRYRFMTALQ